MNNPSLIDTKKILIIGKETGDFSELKKSLIDLQHSVGFYTFQESQFKSIQGFNPELILLDTENQAGWCLELSQSLKENTETKNISIILLTDPDSTIYQRVDLNHRVDDCIPRNAAVGEIILRVNTQLRLKATIDALNLSHEKLNRAHKKLHSELKAAKKVQEGLLPKNVPFIDGIDFAAKLVQAGPVGGDYYDIIPISDDEVALLVVDVSGHDIASAFIVGMAKISFAAHLATHSHSLKDVLNLVNIDMLRSITTQHYLTAFLAILNVKEQTFRYSKAGHFDQILYRSKSEEIEILRTDGLVLGSFEESLFQEKKTKIEKGDKITFFTDGLFEVPNRNGEQYGFENLITFFKKNGKKSPEEIKQLIFQNYQEYSEGVLPQDDSCLLVVEFIGLDSTQLKKPSDDNPIALEHSINFSPDIDGSKKSPSSFQYNLIEKNEYYHLIPLDSLLEDHIIEFEESLNSLLKKDIKHVVLDFIHTEYLTSGAISSLIKYYKILTTVYKKMALINVSESIRNIIHSVNLQKFLYLLENQQDFLTWKKSLTNEKLFVRDPKIVNIKQDDIDILEVLPKDENNEKTLKYYLDLNNGHSSQKMIIFDFESIQQFSPEIVSRIFEFMERVWSPGKRYHICGMTNEARELFKLLGSDFHLHFHENRETALRHVEKKPTFHSKKG